MTELLDRPETASPTRQAVEAWLSGFQEALDARDVERAAGMFLEQCFWRDLVSFTWNLTTAEGREGVADLLRSTLESTDPTAFALSAEPAEADGVTEAWLTFETAVGRGEAHLRLREGRPGRC